MKKTILIAVVTTLAIGAACAAGYRCFVCNGTGRTPAGFGCNACGGDGIKGN